MATKSIEEKVEKTSYQLRDYIEGLISEGSLVAYSLATRNFVGDDGTVTERLARINKLQELNNGHLMSGDPNQYQILIRNYCNDQYSLTFHSDGSPYVNNSRCTLEKLADTFYFMRRETGEIYIPSEHIVAKIGIDTTVTSGDYKSHGPQSKTLFIEGEKDALFERIYEFAVEKVATEKQQSL